MRHMPAITLGLSLVFGAGAAFLAHSMTRGDDAPARAEQTAAPVTEPVLVASRAIRRGDPIDAAFLKVEDWPVGEAPPASFASFEATGASERAPRYAMADIAAGAPVLDDRLTPAGIRASLAARLQPGYRAVSVPMTEVTGVAGFVLPGDRVDVLFTRDVTPGAEQLTLKTDILAQNVEVLGVDQNDDLLADEAKPFDTATLAVTMDQARALAEAAQQGALSLALRGASDEAVYVAAAEPAPRPRARPALRDEKPVQLAGDQSPGQATVIVALGGEEASVRVPRS